MHAHTLGLIGPAASGNEGFRLVWVVMLEGQNLIQNLLEILPWGKIPNKFWKKMDSKSQKFLAGRNSKISNKFWISLDTQKQNSKISNKFWKSSEETNPKLQNIDPLSNLQV